MASGKSLWRKAVNLFTEPAQKISSCCLRAGDIVDAYVLQVNRDAALVDICYKQDIAIPKRRLAFPEPESAADIVAAGDVIKVYVESLGGENGGVLSKVKADAEELRAIDDIVPEKFAPLNVT